MIHFRKATYCSHQHIATLLYCRFHEFDSKNVVTCDVTCDVTRLYHRSILNVKQAVASAAAKSQDVWQASNKNGILIVGYGVPFAISQPTRPSVAPKRTPLSPPQLLHLATLRPVWQRKVDKQCRISVCCDTWMDRGADWDGVPIWMS